MNQEMLNKISELSNQIARLEQELKGYIHDEEASEPIEYNIDKRKWELEELLMPVKEELNEKEEQKNIEIEKITKEANDRIERLERELKGYIHDEEASEPIKYNIDKIRWELEEKVKNINEKYESEKNNILKDIEKAGIDLEEYGLKEKEELEENKEEKETENIEEKSNCVEEFVTEETEQRVEDNKIEQVEKTVVSNVPETRIVNPILAGKNEDKVEENKEPEIEMLDLGEVKKVSSESIRILYDAKGDKYIYINVNMNKEHFVFRKDIQKIDKSELAEKLGKEVEDLGNIDTNVLQILQEYDEKYNTSKANEYIDMLTKIGKSKKDRQQEMKESQIDIEYNLKGLYDKNEIDYDEYEDKFSKEDREELLSIANNASKKGIATVKKGFITTAMELWGKIISFGSGKIKQLVENRRITLPESKREKIERENRAKAREERLQENENEMAELEEIISKANEKERTENETQGKVETTTEEKDKTEELEQGLQRELSRTKQNKKAAKNIDNVSENNKIVNDKFKYGAVWDNGNIVPRVKVDHKQALDNLNNNENSSQTTIEQVK